MNKKETGRSMVEMLGVLAVVGVLSIGSIAGYTYAMRTHRANEMVDAVSTLYTAGISQAGGIGDNELDYVQAVGTLPVGAKSLMFNPDTSVTIGIEDPDDCAVVKKKYGDRFASGDCTTIDSESSAYVLDIAMGELRSESGESTTPPAVDPCAGITCNGNGSCSEGVCNCNDGYRGDLCEIKRLCVLVSAGVSYEPSDADYCQQKTQECRQSYSCPSSLKQCEKTYGYCYETGAQSNGTMLYADGHCYCFYDFD